MLTSLDSLLPTTSLDLLDDPPQRETSGSRLLRFSLGSKDSALLPLEQIATILVLDVAEILPIPEMPSCVLGIGNYQGEMLWLIDLNNLVGYPPLTLAILTSPMAIVVHVNNQSVGLVVEQVNDIELHDLQTLHAPAIGLFSPSLLPFVLGSLLGGRGIVLNVTAITQCPLWQIHQSKGKS